MSHTVDHFLTKAFSAAPWLFQPAGPDVLLALADALGDDWTVCCETDCEGENSIIAISTVEADRLPSILLYEKGGMPHVASVVDDEWCGERAFDTVHRAMGAFITLARLAHIDADGPASPNG
jgi:hypothetical protein